MSGISISVDVKIDTSALDAMAAGLPAKASQAVMKTAAAIEADAKDEAPVDTGALRNSIHTEKEDELTAVVSDGVEYGIYQELGTRKMAAQPFLIPAVERNVDTLIDNIRSAFA